MRLAYAQAMFFWSSILSPRVLDPPDWRTVIATSQKYPVHTGMKHDEYWNSRIGGKNTQEITLHVAPPRLSIGSIIASGRR